MAAAGGFSAGGQGGNTDDAVATLRRMAGAAPAAIRADVEKVAEAMRIYFKALKDAGIDFSNPSTYSSQTAAQALQSASSQLANSGATDASHRIDTYFKSLCPS